MSAKGVGRVLQDRAGGLIGKGANTVFTNNKKTAIVTSVIVDRPNKGDVIVQSNTTVFAENQRLAVQGAVTARGYVLQRASETVFAGKEPGPGKIEISPPNISVK